MKSRTNELVLASIIAVLLIYIVMEKSTHPQKLQAIVFRSGYGGQEPTSASTGIRFTGETSRIYNLPRYFKSFRPETNGGQRYQTKHHTCSKWIVFTTIFIPSESVKKIKRIVDSQTSWCCVVVFDKKTPVDQYIKFQNEKFILLTVEDQRLLASRERGYKIVEKIPWNNFARKNIGYLYAIHQKAEVIFDVDDDNLLLQDEIPIATRENGYSYVASTNNMYNPYKDFLKTNVAIWPRGFPLDYIKSTNQTQVNSAGTRCRPSLDGHVSIQQFLANHDPDLDAIYRLTGQLPVYFENTERKPVVLQTGTLCPYNAQATVHLNSAFYGLFMPTTVSGRVSDIWRSYYTQRLQWDIGGNIAFTKPHVIQIRNVHDYMADFQSELALYSKTSALVQFLLHWRSKSKSLPERMEELAIEFYERNYWELDDVELIQLWIQDLTDSEYQFPKVLDFEEKDCF